LTMQVGIVLAIAHLRHRVTSAARDTPLPPKRQPPRNRRRLTGASPPAR
jgi:hypothetical protein